MSIIIPSGNKNIQWLPEKDMVKTASTDQKEVEVDDLFNAAKTFLNKKAEAACENADKPVDKPADKPVEKESATEVPTPSTMKESGDDKPCEKVEEAIDSLKDAVEKVEDAVCDGAKKEDEEVEVEIPGVVDDEAAEIEIEIEPEDGTEDKGEMIVETNTACAASDNKETKTADSTEEFMKFSAISPENKKKIKKLWKDDLGYPAEYVDLMVKDYEK